MEAIWGAAGQDVARLPEFLSDGLHLTVAGYQVSNFYLYRIFFGG
jgi:lysophospholipase L1-like esterase